MTAEDGVPGQTNVRGPWMPVRAAASIPDRSRQPSHAVLPVSTHIWC